jgi:hypothetical protein
MPAISPPPPDRDDDRVDVGLLQQLGPDHARAGRDLGLVVGVHEHRAGARRVLDRGLVGLGVLVADLVDGRAVAAQPRDLDRGRGGRDERGRRHTQRLRDVRVGQARVAARGDDDADLVVELAGLAR